MQCRIAPASRSSLFTLEIAKHSALRRSMATEARQDAKKKLRSEIKQRLSALSEDSIAAQSKKAQQLILSLPQYKHAKRVGIYLSMPKAEAQTDVLVHDALRNGKAVFVPHIFAVGTEKPKYKVMDMLRLSSLDEYQSLERDAWDIPKLSREGREDRENAMGGTGLSLNTENGSAKEMKELSALDLIVVPGVAFDPQMNRMGHGAGFYDKFLERFCEDGKRRKPFLGMTSQSSSSNTCSLTSASRSLPCRTDAAAGRAGHGDMGLESGCGRRRRWQLADFKWHSMSFSFLS